MPGPKEQLLMNEFVKLLIEGLDLNSAQKSALLHNDRALVAWGKLVGTTGTRDRLVKLELTGEQAAVAFGKDSDGNVDAVQTSDVRKLKVEGV